MLELGQLERQHEEFSRRNTRVVATSVEPTAQASQTQADFPHLTVLADEGRGLAQAAGVMHPHSAPDGADTSAPTTLLIDSQGRVRFLFRPSAAQERLPTSEVLRALDAARDDNKTSWR